jgi:hypothetical protein
MRTKRGLLPGSAGLLLFCVAMSMQAYAIHRRNVVTGDSRLGEDG